MEAVKALGQPLIYHETLVSRDWGNVEIPLILGKISYGNHWTLITSCQCPKWSLTLVCRSNGNHLVLIHGFANRCGHASKVDDIWTKIRDEMIQSPEHNWYLQKFGRVTFQELTVIGRHWLWVTVLAVESKMWFPFKTPLAHNASSWCLR